MIALLHIPILITSVLVLLAMRRFWVCIKELDLVQEVGKRTPDLVRSDIAAATFGTMSVLIAASQLTGIPIPPAGELLHPSIGALSALVCLGVCIFHLRNTGWRLAGNRTDARERALHLLLELGIQIDAKEKSL